MPLPLSVSCFSKIQTGFAFLVPAYPDSPGKGAVKRVGVSCIFGYTTLEIWRKIGLSGDRRRWTAALCWTGTCVLAGSTADRRSSPVAWWARRRSASPRTRRPAPAAAPTCCGPSTRAPPPPPPIRWRRSTRRRAARRRPTAGRRRAIHRRPSRRPTRRRRRRRGSPSPGTPPLRRPWSSWASR